VFPLRSHLDFPHVASGTSHLPAANGGMAGVGADVATSVPAPVAASNDLLKRVAIVGGVALLVFLLLRQLQKSKT
jgi:hypothetical protein